VSIQLLPWKIPYRSVDEFSIIIIDSCEYIIYNAKANDVELFVPIKEIVNTALNVIKCL
jgi:hypothetical protein